VRDDIDERREDDRGAEEREGDGAPDAATPEDLGAAVQLATSALLI